MRVLFITDGPSSPGSRYRCLQYFPHLEERGISCDVQFAYDTRYNALVQTAWSKPYRLMGRLRRTAGMLIARGYDLLYLHKTALAFTGLPELLRSRMSTPMVFDFDDAIHLGPGASKSLARMTTFRQVVRAANKLIPGNSYLAEVAGAPEKTTVIPTVVDTDIYRPAAPRDDGSFVVGWMGTSGNFPYLRTALPGVLAALSRIPGGRMHIVSNASLEEYAHHPLVSQTRWSAPTELESLRSFDVGLMPLPDTPSTRGKCGFKLLQYLSVGVPVVAAAVGANVEIMQGHDVGYLLREGEDWGATIASLAANPPMRARMGKNGRQRVEAKYSIRSALPQLEQVLRAAANQHSPPRAI